MHPEILNSYNSTLSESITNYKKLFKEVIHIDTSDKGINDVNYKVTNQILETLRINTSEKIGYFDINSIDHSLSGTFKLDSLIKENTKIEFSSRPEVEYDQSKIQPIPIVVITNKTRDRVLVVKKNKKQTSSNSPESEKLLIYLGGHTRDEDVIQSSEKGTLSILKYCLQRELKEETGIDFYPKNNSPFCIWSKSNERSKLHIAICFVYEVDFERIKINLDKNEFITQGRTKSGQIISVKELINQYSSLEDWSKLIVKEVFPPISYYDRTFPFLKDSNAP